MVLRWFWWTSLLGTRECEGFRGARALIEPIDSNRSFPVISTPNVFGCSGNFSTHTGFQVQSVLFWVGIANLRLGDFDNHVCYEFG